MNFLVSGAAKLNGGHNAAADYDVSTTLDGVEIWYQSHDCETVKRAFYRACRRTFLRTYVLASAEVMEVLADLLQKVGPTLDAGCGSGYLSKELVRLGVLTFAVDCSDFSAAHLSGHGYPIKKVYKVDALGNAASFVSSRFGAVLLTWPPYDSPFALRVAEAMMPGQLLVYEGEDVGGCTANDAFFEFMSDDSRWERQLDDSAHLDAVHVTLDTLHDHWTVWKRLG